MKIKNTSLSISRRQAVLAAIIFIVTSISFYSFFYVSREAIRIMSITYENDIWILDVSAMRFYNRIYAAIALIIGMGATSRFLVEIPKSKSINIRQRISLINDSRVLNWVFLMWALQLGVVFGLFWIASRSHYEFSIYPEHKWMLIGIVVVLYLQQWVSYRRLFTFFTAKAFIPATILMIGLTFLLGSYRVVNLDNVDKRVLAKDPYRNIHISRPISDSFIYWSRYPSTIQLYYGFPIDTTIIQKPILLNEDAETIVVSEIEGIVEHARNTTPSYHHHRLRFQLNIDENLEMQYVKELQNEIINAGVRLVGNGVIPSSLSNVNQLTYKNYVLPQTLYPNSLTQKVIEDDKESLSIYIILIDLDEICFQDSIVTMEELSQKFDTLIESDENSLIQFEFHANTSYGLYLKAHYCLRKVHNAKMDKYSMYKYGVKYEFLDREKKQEVRDVYRFRLVDVML